MRLLKLRSVRLRAIIRGCSCHCEDFDLLRLLSFFADPCFSSLPGRVRVQVEEGDGGPRRTEAARARPMGVGGGAEIICGMVGKGAEAARVSTSALRGGG